MICDCPLRKTNQFMIIRTNIFIIFSPDRKNYSWVKMLSVQSIEEFPQPITYETHQDGLEVLQNMTIARRFTIENPVVDMINIVEQIDSHVCSSCQNIFFFYISYLCTSKYFLASFVYVTYRL